jgi:hypothetical protein
MPAYVLVGVDVTDLEVYGEYTRGVPATLEPYGGRFVVRGGEFEVPSQVSSRRRRGTSRWSTRQSCPSASGTPGPISWSSSMG